MVGQREEDSSVVSKVQFFGARESASEEKWGQLELDAHLE